VPEPASDSPLASDTVQAVVLATFPGLKIPPRISAASRILATDITEPTPEMCWGCNGRTVREYPTCKLAGCCDSDKGFLMVLVSPKGTDVSSFELKVKVVVVIGLNEDGSEITASIPFEATVSTTPILENMIKAQGVSRCPDKLNAIKESFLRIYLVQSQELAEFSAKVKSWSDQDTVTAFSKFYPNKLNCDDSQDLNGGAPSGPIGISRSL
jgi:hypothetical protein